MTGASATVAVSSSSCARFACHYPGRTSSGAGPTSSSIPTPSLTVEVQKSSSQQPQQRKKDLADQVHALSSSVSWQVRSSQKQRREKSSEHEETTHQSSILTSRRSQNQQRGKTLANQLYPLSEEFLEVPPPARSSVSPTRKRARDSTRQNRLKPSSQGPVANKVIELLADASEEELVSILDSEVSFLTSKDLVIILNAQTQWQRALLFFDWAKSKSFPMNSFVYNVMLKIMRKAEKWEYANSLVKEMKENNVALDNVTYSTIISFALRCHKQDEALHWFSRMQEAGCPPDSVTYSAVIEILAKSGRMQEAVDLCARMQEEISPWDWIVYSLLMKLHAMQHEFDQMWDVYRDMQAAGVVPNVVTYNALISLLGNAGRSIQVSRLFNDMLNNGLKPSPVTLSLMFRTFAKTRDIEEAFKLYEKTKEEGWLVDTVVYNSLLNLCAQMGRVKDGERVYNELLESKVCKPDDWTWRTLVDMYVKGGVFEEARRITKEMVNQGRSIDLPVYMNLIQGYGKMKDFQSVLLLMNDIRLAKVPYDHMLAGALLSVFISCEEAGAEEREALLNQIGLVYPNLKVVIDNLYAKKVSLAKMKRDMRNMLNGAAEDCRKPLCNLLMELCWVKQLARQAHDLLSIGLTFGLYSDLQVRSPVEWCLRLRTLSFGAARTALYGWISSIKAAFQSETNELPFEFSIEVGLGTQSFPDDSVPVMGTVILQLLQEMRSPFKETRDGCLTASIADVKDWILAMKDSKVPDIASVVI
ncbi:hypothetical protein KP509_15G014300 [Ceratopteris richardii]|nr:hypothetical protein KP509_15G014300 [Ceratopteris richardii]